MDATRSVGDLRDDDSVRLSGAQKRDLLGMSAAAVITAGLMVGPALVPRDQDAEPLASRSVLAMNATPVVIETRSAPLVAVTTSPARVPLAVRRTTTASPGWVARPATPTVMAMTARVEAPRKPLARRLAGFLTGDGTHAIRPFPTIPAERQ